MFFPVFHKDFVHDCGSIHTFALIGEGYLGLETVFLIFLEIMITIHECVDTNAKAISRSLQCLVFT